VLLVTDGTSRGRLLFVSPVVPALTGNGLAMRSGAVLRALVRPYAVTLLVVPLYGERAAPIADAIRACCARIIRLGGTETLATNERFDVVHVYRLASLLTAEPWLRQAGWRQLDLDDVESVSRRRIAALHRMLGDETAALREETAASHARMLEDAALARFDRVAVCSAQDRDYLGGRGRAGIVVVPNTLPLPETTPLPPAGDGPATLLFVGTLGYFPNEDAARLLCTEILPLVQAGSDRPITARIVGAGARPSLHRLSALPGVEIVGPVDDVSPSYRDAHVVVVPLRAGGGTRIKILEAFAQGRPVVSTTIGIEGIAAASERHALIADEPQSFAAACLRLLRDATLAESIAREAFALFTRAYSDETLATAIAALAPGSSPRESPVGDVPPAPR
jgi:polysaccharide biosynthesis protein PslH